MQAWEVLLPPRAGKTKLSRQDFFELGKRLYLYTAVSGPGGDGEIDPYECIDITGSDYERASTEECVLGPPTPTPLTAQPLSPPSAGTSTTSWCCWALPICSS